MHSYINRTHQAQHDTIVYNNVSTIEVTNCNLTKIQYFGHLTN